MREVILKGVGDGANEVTEHPVRGTPVLRLSSRSHCATLHGRPPAARPPPLVGLPCLLASLLVPWSLLMLLCLVPSAPRPCSLLHAVYMYIHTSLPILSFTSTLLPVHTSFLLHYTPLPIPLLPCCPLQHQSALCILVVATHSHIGHMIGSTCLAGTWHGLLRLVLFGFPSAR